MVVDTATAKQICELEDGHKAFAFSTGMAALSAVTRIVRTGQEIILNDDSYGGTYRLLSKVMRTLVMSENTSDELHNNPSSITMFNAEV